MCVYCVPRVCSLGAETVCMLIKEKEEDLEKEERGEGGEGERDEDMEDVREGSAGGHGCNIRDKWMLSHDITPLAMELLTSRGVSDLDHYTLCTSVCGLHNFEIRKLFPQLWFCLTSPFERSLVLVFIVFTPHVHT